MTEEVKIALVKAMSDETNDETIRAFLFLAGETLYKLADPHKKMTFEKFIDVYGSTQAKAAAWYLNKRGWDFETSHSENGVSRVFEAGDLPPSILRELIPVCGVTS